MQPVLPAFDFAPFRLSGEVVGALLNDPAALSAPATASPATRWPPT